MAELSVVKKGGSVSASVETVAKVSAMSESEIAVKCDSSRGLCWRVSPQVVRQRCDSLLPGSEMPQAF